MSARGKKKKDFPAWHPDFRVTDDLPDIKAVRTDFLINIGSVGLALALLVYILYREANLYSLSNELATLQAEQARLTPENNEAVALNTRFLKQKHVFDDLSKFYDAPVDVPRFLTDIAAIRPADISFEEIAYQELQQASKESVTRTYRIFMRGQTRNLQDIDILKDALYELPYLQEMDTTITEDSNPRNTILNTFGFAVEVRFQPAAKG
jgi:hypothetical protein